MRELEESLDSCEVSEWFAFFQIEPPADPYGHTALMCSVMNNLWAKQRVKPSYFDPREHNRQEVDNPIVAEANFAIFAAQHNARLGAK